VQGFAFTLGLTTIIDVVVVFLFTKPLMTVLARTKFFGEGHRLSGVDPERVGRPRRTPRPSPAVARGTTGPEPKEA
jgi:preprotein translocase subunit SecD